MTPQKDQQQELSLINHAALQPDQDTLILTGWEKLTGLIHQKIDRFHEKNHPVVTIGIDGYPGTDWYAIKERLADSFQSEQVTFAFWNVEECLLPPKEMDVLLQPYLGDDPVFGRIYKKNLSSLFDQQAVSALREKMARAKNHKGMDKPEVIVCYGTGALLGKLLSKYDLTIYFDLTREAALKRNKQWSQLSGKTQSISPKKLYYVDMQVNDRHRNHLLKRIDYYVDGTDGQQPKLLSAHTLQKLTEALAGAPIRLKYMYEPGPWGGQWLKKIRHLPEDWINCAWSYEVIATEQSLLAAIGNTVIELPWTTFFYLQYDTVMGNVPKRRFRGEFPIRFDYLDTVEGGDLSIQAHPTTAYIREHFGETYHQGEMYYIVEAREGASAKLGLREDADLDKFKQAALLAEEKGMRFDGFDYVNKVPCQKHDLLMIPPGTVHGSGEGLVVLEISATTYRYTFKIYDYLRPDLSGVMRPIHIQHAFNVIKPYRRNKWVAENLIQQPQLIRSGNDWAEYLIGDRREFFHVVFRLEFDHQIEDDTCGKFHILTLVEGDSVKLCSLTDASKSIHIGYSETIIIPACFGKYQMTHQGQGSCKVVKARLR